jgi:hypothetical protein
VANFGCNYSGFVGIPEEVGVVMKRRGKHRAQFSIADGLKKNLPDFVE